MRFPSAYSLRTQYSTGVQGVTGAAPITVAGNALDSGLASLCLGARVYAKATTSSLTLSAKWQVLDDNGTTWIDVVESNNPANVVLVTGTGSAVTATKMISAPLAVIAGCRQARVVVLSAGGTGGGAGTDECSIAYDFRAPVSAYGS
jgi:hypothetical protein